MPFPKICPKPGYAISGFIHVSIVKSPVPKFKSALDGVVTRSPSPSKYALLPPNTDFVTDCEAFPSAVKDLLDIEESLKALPMPSPCKRSFI